MGDGADNDNSGLEKQQQQQLAQQQADDKKLQQERLDAIKRRRSALGLGAVADQTQTLG